jgi:hypothetical protein
VLDDHGVPTVSITQVPEITELAQPSLSCFVAHPFGLTLGNIDDKKTQRAALLAVLEAAYSDAPAGSIVDLGFAWELDDLRERQLRNEAL